MADRSQHRARTTALLVFLAGVAAAAGPSDGRAQVPRAPEDGGFVMSLGQPPRWLYEAGLGAGAFLPEATRELTVRVSAGAYRSVFPPVTGLPELGVEGYVGARSSGADGGVRAMLRARILGAGIGADYNVPTGSTDMVVMVRSPVRRGGLLRHGSQLRLDWYPLSSQGFTLTITTPLGEPLAGRDRPLRAAVAVAGRYEPVAPHTPSTADVMRMLDSLRVSATWIRQLVVPYLDQDGRDDRQALQRTHGYLQAMAAHLAVRSEEAEVRHWHATMEAMFAAAAGDPAAGPAIAARARADLLEHVLLPYDRLLGRKKVHDSLADMIGAARGSFARWVTTSGRVPRDRAGDVLFAFQGLGEILDGERSRAGREWDDPRLAWLPLQYALLPEDHDEQSEIDALLERATGARFSAGNRIRYVANVQFLDELHRMIRETQRYHVLWVHDFPSVSDGAVDRLAVSTVLAYLTTLAARVRAYDSTLALPTFYIFQDEFYYDQRGSRRLMTILEDPLRASVDLRPADPGMERALEDALLDLRAAVAGSRVLAAERREYGEAWVRNRIKVHVNITNRPDPSFWGGDLVGSLFGYADDIMRDHRKITFRDVSESDPYAGEGIVTGMGVGLQYTGPSWDDRSLVLRGPVLLDLRRAARTLLLEQGMSGGALPPALREQPPADQHDAPALDGFDARAVVLFNSTGYGSKMIDVGKAVLYTLMPGGSVFKIPDSLWNSTFYGAAVLGACLRGGRALIIAPAQVNAPSAGFPQMARARELFTRLLMARVVLGPALTAAGGDLRTGIYALPPDERGFASRVARWSLTMDTSSFLRTLFPFAPALMPVMTAAAQADVHDGVPDATPPRLHHKVQVLVSRGLWEAITASPEWPRFMTVYVRYRAATHEIGTQAPEARQLPDTLEAIAERMLAGAEVPPGAAAYAIVGSQNMDYRGMFMDGEVGAVLTGAEVLVPLADLAFLAGTVTWVDDQAALDRLVAPVTEWQRRAARYMKDGI